MQLHGGGLVPLRIALQFLAVACGNEGGDAPPPTAAATPPSATARVDASGPPVDASPTPVAFGIGTCVPAGLGAGGIATSTRNFTMTVNVTARDPERDVFDRSLRRQVDRFRLCHEDAVRVHPEFATTSIHFGLSIGPTSGVAPSINGPDAVLSNCVADVVGEIQAALPNGIGPVRARASLGFEVGRGSRRIGRSEPDVAMISEALRARTEALRACLPLAANGDATLSLQVDRKGVVTSAEVEGAPDAAAVCLVDVVKGTTLPGGASGSLRCPLIFGD